MAEKIIYNVDIDENCMGQEFTVSRMLCFVSSKPIVIVNGMGLGQSYIDNGESDEVIIGELLSTVKCVPISIRKVA